MKRAHGIVSALSCAALIGGSAAQQITTPAEAFRAGQTFSNSTQGGAAASRAINPATAGTNVPRYNTNPPEANVFGNGRNLIGGAGTTRQADCRTRQAGNGYDQQECNAVNFLNRSPGERPRFNIDGRTDPLIVNSGRTIANPGQIPAAGESACHIVRTTTPASYTQESCTEIQTLTDVSCNRVLNVQVTRGSNCTEGAAVQSAGFGWGYDYRRGLDLYLNGGMARALCYPAETDQVVFGFFAGNVVESQYGSGSEFTPPPNPALLPVQETATLPTTVVADTVMPVTRITVLPGSGCNADDTCSYRFSHGPATHACSANELVRYQRCTFDVEMGEACSDELAPSAPTNAPAQCYSAASAPAQLDALERYTCSGNEFLSGDRCYTPTGNVSHIIGSAPGGYLFTLGFPRPRVIVTMAESWDTSQCSQFETRAQR